MKVAVAASGDSLDAPTDPRFGRCAWFVIVDADSMAFEAVQNTGAMAGSGAGIQAAQLVANAGAEAVVDGHMGPNAFAALSQGGLQVFLGGPGTVRQAVEALKAGQLAPANAPDVQAHFGTGGGGMAAPGAPMGGPGAPAFMGPGGGGGMGMGQGMGRGMGMGMGGGRGRGGGRGMGMGGGGMGRGMGTGRGGAMGGSPGMPPGMPTAAFAQAATPEQELQMLRSQAQMLTQQLSHINARIAQLEAQRASEEG